MYEEKKAGQLWLYLLAYLSWFGVTLRPALDFLLLRAATSQWYIVFNLPPNWTPSMPHLSMPPTLAAYLQPQGIQVIQRDLNLELFDEILTRPYMENALAHLRQGLLNLMAVIF